MIHYFRRAVKDIFANGFLNAVTVFTVALAVLIFGAFALIYVNAEALLYQWVGDIRVMAYVKSDAPGDAASRIEKHIREVEGVSEVIFIPKDEALERFKGQLGRQASLVDGLNENPLPDAFEIRVDISPRDWSKIEPAAGRIEKIEGIAEVEYGQIWLGRFLHVLNLFRLTGYAMGALFLTGAIFFVANTIRLVLYSRRDEIEILRLVGASEGFIKDPFYIQSFILGGLGGCLGMAGLFGLGAWISAKAGPEMASELFQVRFLPVEMILGILGGSVFVGWVGCFLSLRRFLKS